MWGAVLRKILLGALVPGAVLLFWHQAATTRGESGIVPTVGEVAEKVLHPGERPATIDAPPLWFSVQTTVLRVAIGYGLAVIVAVPAGLMMGRTGWLQEVFGPTASMMRVVCPIAWMPVAILILGITPMGEILFGPLEGWKYERLNSIRPAMLLIVGWGAFFPVLLASADAAGAVRRGLLESATLMGATRWQRFRHVVVPHALPGILSGMRIGLGVSWMVIIAAELYPGTRSGLGYTIEASYTDNLQYGWAFAALAYIMLVGVVLNGGLWLVEKRVGHWRREQR
jgi:NitT/TauT family transport system permease protein